MLAGWLGSVFFFFFRFHDCDDDAADDTAFVSCFNIPSISNISQLFCVCVTQSSLIKQLFVVVSLSLSPFLFNSLFQFFFFHLIRSTPNAVPFSHVYQRLRHRRQYNNEQLSASHARTHTHRRAAMPSEFIWQSNEQTTDNYFVVSYGLLKIVCCM